MKLMTLAAAAAALLTTSLAAAPADAQPVRERTVVKTTTTQPVRERTVVRKTVVRTHHRRAGWGNHHRSRTCRVTIRHHVRHRVCTTRW
jgi:hypothetical protein